MVLRHPLSVVSRCLCMCPFDGDLCACQIDDLQGYMPGSGQLSSRQRNTFLAFKNSRVETLMESSREVPLPPILYTPGSSWTANPWTVSFFRLPFFAWVWQRPPWHVLIFSSPPLHLPPPLCCNQLGRDIKKVKKEIEEFKKKRKQAKSGQGNREESWFSRSEELSIRPLCATTLDCNKSAATNPCLQPTPTILVPFSDLSRGTK